MCIFASCASPPSPRSGTGRRDTRHVKDMNDKNDYTTSRYVVEVVNPLLASPEGEGKCPFFRRSEKVRVAYGFKQAMALVPHGKARAVRYALQEYMCERDFYYLRRGDKPIYPEMQRRIAADLAKAGAPAPIEFDRYEWRYDWR